jgi:hypothetical protein
VPAPRKHSDAEIAAVSGRFLVALGRRLVEDGDLNTLSSLAKLHEDAGRLLHDAVHALRAEPHAFSWAQVGEALGISRQAAQQRFGRVGARRAGGQPGDLR